MTPGDPILSCRGLRKSYRGAQFTLGGTGDGLTFDVAGGELFALVGPSGCGKTTTLRIIGGFTTPDAGTVVIEGVDVTRRPPYARPTNTVFQHYALFPHMTVGANVGFGLVMEGVSVRERRVRVREALELVGLQGFETRRVPELSGGQQQRAALARALVKRPTLLLLDEPMGSLDAQLRKQMQDELVRLKTQLGTTFVHVTHDQEEACAVADRMGVMQDGRLVQVDSPTTLYRRPNDSYVASFLDIGTVIRGTNTHHGDLVEIATADVTVKAPTGPYRRGGGAVAAVIPADKIVIRAAADCPDLQVRGVVSRVVFAKLNYQLTVRVGADLDLRACLSPAEFTGLGSAAAAGSQVSAGWDPEDVIVVADSGTAAADMDAPVLRPDILAGPASQYRDAAPGPGQSSTGAQTGPQVRL